MLRFHIVAACAVIGVASLSWAGVCDDTVIHYPWVYSVSGWISYNPTTGVLDVESYPVMYNKDGTPGGGIDLYGYTDLLLHAIIDPETKTVSPTDSTLYVTDGNGWDMFYSTRAAEFDYDFDNNGQISFRFWQDGNMEAPNNGNVVVHLWTGASGFDTLDGATLNYADTFFLPEPATMTLLALGGLLLARRRRLNH